MPVFDLSAEELAWTNFQAKASKMAAVFNHYTQVPHTQVPKERQGRPELPWPWFSDEPRGKSLQKVKTAHKVQWYWLKLIYQQSYLSI